MCIFLFDVDGTLVDSGQNIEQRMIDILIILSNYGELGIVGGGTYEKIKQQLNSSFHLFTYIFAESGSCFYKNNTLINQNKIRNHNCYETVDKLKKVSFKFLAEVDYNLTGTILDQRESLLYISLIGMQANINERSKFIKLDEKYNYRQTLLNILKETNTDPNLEICFGGSVGIAVHPKEWNKSQVLKYLDHKTVYYFGDKYTTVGNDYPLIIHPRVNGIKIDNPNMTYNEIDKIIKDFENK